MEDFMEGMIRHFGSDGIRQRFEMCSEFSIVEQWLRVEIYRFLRETMGWSVLQVEGPYCTRAPTKSDKTKSWEERVKWCDLVAFGPDGVYWFELKAVWYRSRSWKSNLNSAVRDFIALVGMDEKLTADIWAGRGERVSLGNFLRQHSESIRKGPHNRFSICLLQAMPDDLLEKGPGQNLFSTSKRYLRNRSEKLVVVLDSLGRAGHPPKILKPEDPSSEACRIAAGVSPMVHRIGRVDRGRLFPEETPKGRLALAVWEAP